MAAVPASAQQQDLGALRLLIGASAIFVVLTAGLYVWTLSWAGPFPRDGSTLVVGRDFLNFWMYGRAAWAADPGRFYDPLAYRDALAALLGADYPGQNWSYPPSVMLVAAPFGRLPYLAALVCWTVIGLAVFAWVARRHVADRRLLAAILISPAAVFCLISGQSSLVTAAMLLTIFAWLDRKPLLAGILLGLLTLKPQLGVLFPVMLVASGRWRVFLVAGATALLIAATTTALFGPQIWIDFVQKGLPVQNLVLADPDRIGTAYYPTIFMNLRGAGASYALAMVIQACFSAFAIGAVFFAFRYREDGDPQLLAALFFACSICAVPYLLSYDTLPATCLAVMLLGSGRLDLRGEVLAKLLYWLPLIQMALGTAHIPGAALIPPAFALYALMRLKADRGMPAHAAPARAAPAVFLEERGGK
jgi:Glycosyltransferase family 87